MFDRGAFWSPVPVWESACIEGNGVRLRTVPLAAIWQLGGDSAALLETLGVPSPLGPRDACTGERYALRLAPGSVLLCSGTPCELEAGWRADGIAASALVDGFLAFDVEGPRAGVLLSMAAEYPFDTPPGNPAESAQLLFAGLRVLLARRPQGWRLHIERPWAAALWHWLAQHAAQT